jgi:DNA-binding NtrC family response regulator
LTARILSFYRVFMIELVFMRNGRPCLRQRVSETTINIGRDYDNHVQLADEEISRHHCSIEWQNGKYILTDRSKNGTFVNNRPVKTSLVNAGDTITVGNWNISVVEAGPEKAEPTISRPGRTTSILNFDAEKKTLSSERLILSIQPPEDKQYDVVLKQTVATIGSLESCDVKLNDPFVSRHHCSIEHRNGRVLLVDLGSTNGTYVENIRIEQVSIPSRGSFRVGKTLIRYKLDHDIETIGPSKRESLGPMIGKSRAMREVYSLLERVAPSDAVVLLTGESGTGKELAAKLLHQMSHRFSKTFVSINCGALPASIIESQLFGHERGAFTGAVEKSTGLFEQADGGTLFLDEIGEMPLELQTRLLQVLENRTVRRLGAKSEIEIDFRLIAATNKDLKKLTQEHRFRQDLFYRLYVVPVNLPPLRERKGDIPLLADYFADLFSPARTKIKFTDAAVNKLENHNWPGNVRELKNVIQRSIILSEKSTIDAGDISFAPIFAEDVEEKNLEAKEREIIIAALKENKGMQIKAAKQLGIARTTLAAKIARYEIDLEKL